MPSQRLEAKIFLDESLFDVGTQQRVIGPLQEVELTV